MPNDHLVAEQFRCRIIQALNRPNADPIGRPFVQVPKHIGITTTLIPDRQTAASQTDGATDR